MSRQDAIARAQGGFDDRTFHGDLARRIAMPTVSREAAHASDCAAYLAAEMRPAFARLGFAVEIFENPGTNCPFLLARRSEPGAAFRVLQYGHGDVIAGLDGDWSAGLSPWRLTERAGRWYGRGVADNKGQHSVNLAGIEAALAARGRLGFDIAFLIEMGEESGSPGLAAFCAAHREALTADVFIASDGPRLSAGRPTIFLGARGCLSFNLTIEARRGFHHSGNWGGLLANPGIELAHAIASLTGPTGQIRLAELTPPPIADTVRKALANCPVEPSGDDPAIEDFWGEPGLTRAEKVYAWSSLEVMEMSCGNLERPLYAIPPKAQARMQLRFPVGVEPEGVVPAVRRHLDQHGFSRVRVEAHADPVFEASRLDPENPWVARIAASLERTSGMKPAILPNLGGSLPNNIFSDLLGLPTIWIPHSYPGCQQHAPDEHVPGSLLREALGLMAGLYWDMGEPGFMPAAAPGL